MNHGIIFNLGTEPSGMTARTVGAYRIASILRENNWDIEVIDFFNGFTDIELDLLINSRISQRTKFIGISWLFSDDNKKLRLFLDNLKSKYPNLIVLSGSNQKLDYRYDSIDYHVYGYGENALLKLMKYLFSNETRPHFDINTNGERTKSLNANNYPSFPMPNLTTRYEKRDYLLSDEFLGFQTARGCIFQCSFCQFPNIGVKEDYTRSHQSFEEELRENYDLWGIKNYIIADETFNDRSDKIIKYANVVERLNFSPWFSAFIRPELLFTRKSDCEHLIRMGVLGHFYGVDSLNKETRKLIFKGYDPDKLKTKLLDTIDYFRKNNDTFVSTASFIVGLPKENLESLNDTKEWLKKYWKNDHAIFFPLYISIGKNARKSKIDLNYEEYGYDKLIEERSGKHFDGLSDRVVQGNENNVLFWKNEYMNFFEAGDIADNMFHEVFNESNKVNELFALGAFSLTGSPKERILSGELMHHWTYNLDINLERVNSYKQKKLAFV
jgi:radical SAM superfamily enzyme YgiQ (UPF0313 family)